MCNRIELRQMENPYLHDMFKSVLTYDAERVKKELSFQIGGKLLTQYELLRPYQEYSGERKLSSLNKNADVLWLLASPDRQENGYRYIIHEVKTGRWSFDEVTKRYKGVEFLHTRAVTAETPLYIWSWKKYHPKREEIEDFFSIECGREKPDGSCRVIQLDILLPILKERVDGVFEWKEDKRRLWRRILRAIWGS